jgi:tRNA(fMet)-specific endonuclease VapC
VSRYCLDTSAYSNYQRGDVVVNDLLDRATWVGVPSIVIGELEAGFASGSRRDANRAEFAAFLAHPSVVVVPIDRDVALAYAEIITDLRGQGAPLPPNDVWIAACAAEVGAPVLTYDDHFRSIQRVGAIVLK